ncbi:TnsA-like heteromeric transposase endonuclease subunit [Glaciihabitans sp. dw_435]|uniref:TnsA-like heteromeric transposase endonuclease subunit n=1 Tax=Glaciihabitans sp. dw_435 TaxID=2720081 RepID=UPI001BD47584
MAERIAVLRRKSLSAADAPHSAYLLNGHQHQIEFTQASRVAFEHCAPVRQFPSWRGKRNYSGSYWSSTNNSHVEFESFYERTALMQFDRDSSVVAISSQPMWIVWPSGSEPRSHAPDFFLRHANGDGEVIDVRPEKRIDDVAVRSFDATRRMCELAGLRYRVVSDLDATLDQNLRLLSRYRDRRWAPPLEALDQLMTLAGQTLALRALIQALSRNVQESPAAGWVYSMIWAGTVNVDLRKPLGLDQVVHVPGRTQS